MKTETSNIEVDILKEVYVDDDINNREVADDEETLNSLANSIEQTGGLLQPIIIYPTPDIRLKDHGCKWELGSGYRRVAALKRLAETTGDEAWVTAVPASVREVASIGQRHIDQLTENLQRKNLNNMEVALAFKKVIDDPDSKMTQADLARSISWPVSSVSNFMRVANYLNATTQGLVMEEKIPWSSAKELASAVNKFKISDQLQNQLALIAASVPVDEFIAKLNKQFNTAEAAADEAAAPVSTGNTEGSQRINNSIRSSQLKDKYIPKLEEMKKAATNDKEKEKLDIYIDAIKFVLNIQGTSLGASLAPWESELEEKALEEKAQNERERLETQFIRKRVTFIKQKLKEIPPATLPDGTANPHRELPTLPQVFDLVKKEVWASLKNGKQAGMEENYMQEGFLVTDVEAFIKKISDAYVESVKKDAENAKRREAAKLEKEAKEKADQEAGGCVAEAAVASA